ncbi:MAG: 6-carboxytetrahydropterin synthase [Flavobacteriaceae bacterium]|nr:6-carboxytetrahydropterin synthase [Flavobacteriaceae bacterium]MCY4267816.1 6-carboxytetrahydropterin synthase [Flavobacteriaceae bacterium]MCY4298651.1 6-carboxytetrahydropterin synthase [Flavobacteriaceae bacterium]
MEKIRITKDFYFEAGHALYGHDQKCQYLHGHGYKLSVTVIGQPIQNKSSPKRGMVMDFGDLKQIVKERIIDLFDHSMILNVDSPHKNIALILEKEGHKIQKVNYNPTCELLLIDFSKRIQNALSPNVILHSMTLYETKDSRAHWYRKDNR